MNHSMKDDAKQIITEAIAAVMPQAAVEKALKERNFAGKTGKIVAVAIGKAAWTMAQAASSLLGEQIRKGIVITKYDHSQGELLGFEVFEAGHPLPDENSIVATEKVIQMIRNLSADEEVLFLISGGGSALFEQLIDDLTIGDLLSVTKQLLACGADIVEINTIRKHLSAVKGGRFAKLCEPNSVFSIVLSDIVGDRLDSIASAPAYPDASTSEDALAIIKKYKLSISDKIKNALLQETPKELSNVETIITGSVRELCAKAAQSAENLGYKSLIITTELTCEAKEAGLFLGAIAKTAKKEGLPYPTPCAIIAGGETIVHLIGKGKGGRNQELALSAARAVSKEDSIIIAAVGSDGTDGPTDAAGGIVDGNTADELLSLGISIDSILENNDAYYALQKCNGLIMTGATGTNVNDLYFALIR